MPAPYCYDYPRPMVTVDLVVFTLLEGSIQFLLIRRKNDPFEGKWAIPGGFLEIDEPVETAARRELKEETGLEIPGAIEPIGYFGRPGRDPRGRTITLAHSAVLRSGAHRIQGGDDAAEAGWFKLGEPVALAFDHAEILATAKQWLARGLVERTLGLDILPFSFERQQLRALFEEAGLLSPEADRWMRTMDRSGKIRTDPDRRGWFHLAVPAT
jgi:8-oxo-dGTP diphosphatase